MAVVPAKTWIAGEVLTASDLNSEFLNIYDNGQSIGFPRTSAADFDGQELILDADGDSSITADTDDQIDFKLGGTDVAVMTETTFTWLGNQIATERDIRGLDIVAFQASTLEARLNAQESSRALEAQVLR